jgi:hypothetical protein
LSYFALLVSSSVMAISMYNSFDRFLGATKEEFIKSVVDCGHCGTQPKMLNLAILALRILRLMDVSSPSLILTSQRISPPRRRGSSTFPTVDAGMNANNSGVDPIARRSFAFSSDGTVDLDFSCSIIDQLGFTTLTNRGNILIQTRWTASPSPSPKFDQTTSDPHSLREFHGPEICP